jgi:hypothetical protein
MTNITLPVAAVMLFTLTLAPPAAGKTAERTRAAVQAKLKAALPDVLACGPSIDDTVVARFKVAPDGSVRGVRITGPQAKTPVGKCIKQGLTALKFAPAANSTPVTYPFRFGASAAAQAPTTGKLARKDLDGLLDVLEGDLKKCGAGEVRASFVVKPSGHTDDVKIADADDAKTEDCVTKRISRVRFPAAAKPTSVQRTFTLTEGEG